MMGRAVVTTLVAAVLLSACFGPMKFRTRFDPVGQNTGATSKPSVQSPADVSVYFANSPDGFTLRENELTVENGYDHRIMGRLTVLYVEGFCDVDPPPSREVIEAELQRRARNVGANAVIYAWSFYPTASEYSEDYEPCDLGRPISKIVGKGWAVTEVWEQVKK